MNIEDSALYRDYVARNPRSKAHAERARERVPTGTSRSLLRHPPFPFYVERAQGVTSVDLDGNERIDFHNNYTTLVHGHGHPAIRAAVAEGLDVTGPWPGDTVFMQARQGRFDVVVAQYHDQGLIPVKYMGIEKGVNVTLGLPFIRTSPDHGTAFDLAGTGTADPESLRTALRYAARMADARGL